MKPVSVAIMMSAFWLVQSGKWTSHLSTRRLCNLDDLVATEIALTGVSRAYTERLIGLGERGREVSSFQRVVPTAFSGVGTLTYSY